MNIFKIWWTQWTLWPKVISIAVLVALLIGIVAGVRSCGKKDVHIDQAELDRINSANRAEREAELRKKVEENQDVLRTNDNRTTIAETNIDQRNAEIDAKVKAADKAVEDAKRQGRDVTEAELRCLLIPDNCS